MKIVIKNKGDYPENLCCLCKKRGIVCKNKAIDTKRSNSTRKTKKQKNKHTETRKWNLDSISKYMLKVNHKDARKRCQICLSLKIKMPSFWLALNIIQTIF